MKQLRAKLLIALLLAVVLVGILLSLLGDYADSENVVETGSKENKTATNYHSTESKSNTIKDHAEASTDEKIEDMAVNGIETNDDKIDPEKTNDMKVDIAKNSNTN